MEGKIDIIDEVKQFMDWPPSTGDSKPVYEDDFSLKLDLDGLQNLVKDDEDIDLIRSVLADTNIANIGDHKYWSWRSKEVKSYNHGFKKVGTVGMETDLYDQFRHTTGSSRSQGYYKVIEADKSIYLPHRRKIHQPIDTLHVNDKSQDATKGIPSSRLNRANNRRLAADINIHKQTFSSETDIFNFNQLMKRRKPVKFARSAIHNWGLYAIEPIAANEMIIEYVGETVRQQVADIRENKYLSSGIGSSYLFRIDENTVVDATKRGGIARFINHCCTPSCTAKIIKV
ncbi:SET-domain-containing protein, partial [Nadsonia fulvescens var. elongata DSM 6958]